MLPQALPSTLLAEELDALLTGVSAFAAQEILTRAPRPEQALSADDLHAITAAADAAAQQGVAHGFVAVSAAAAAAAGR